MAARPYQTATRDPIQSGKSVAVPLESPKVAQVLDVFEEMANETAGTISIFVSPDCRAGTFIGQTTVQPSSTARPVWIHADTLMNVQGSFCILIQSTIDNATIAQNSAKQYLVQIAVSDD